jgi:hypothetical protein
LGDPKIVAAQVDLPHFFSWVPQLFFGQIFFLWKFNLFASANILLWVISTKSKSNAPIWTAREVRAVRIRHPRSLRLFDPNLSIHDLPHKHRCLRRPSLSCSAIPLWFRNTEQLTSNTLHLSLIFVSRFVLSA